MIARKSFLDHQPLIVQILLLLGLVGISTLIFTAIGIALIEPIFGFSGYKLLVNELNNNPESFVSNPVKINALKVVQLVSSIGLFLVPALVFSVLKRAGGDYIGMRHVSTGFWYGMAVVFIFCATPIVAWLYHLNQLLNLPSEDLMTTIRDTEDRAKVFTRLFLQMPSTVDLFFNIFLIAIVPAIAEEFFFRGVLQRMLNDSLKNLHIAVWVTAAVFSFVHFQFLGFLPRMFLGIILGYVFAFSGSIWVAVVAHIFNNGAQVVAAYLYQRGLINYNIEDETAPELWIVAISILLTTAIFLFLYRRRVEATSPILTNTENHNRTDRDDLPFV